MELLTSFEFTDDDVVRKSHDPGGTNGVISPNVGNDIDFRGNGHVGAEEFAPEGGKWTTHGPKSDGVEDEFVAAVRIFLPTCEFVVNLNVLSIEERKRQQQ